MSSHEQIVGFTDCPRAKRFLYFIQLLVRESTVNLYVHLAYSYQSVCFNSVFYIIIILGLARLGMARLNFNDYGGQIFSA